MVISVVNGTVYYSYFGRLAPWIRRVWLWRKTLINIEEVDDKADTLLVLCIDEINTLKKAVNYLHDLGKNQIKVIYEKSNGNLPLREEEPYKPSLKNLC